MSYEESILGVIGGTPLVRLNRISAELSPTVLAKLEFLNPGGSVKDRVGISMIEAAEKEGRLRPGATIVEPTAGNTGIGLAVAAAVKGYRMVFVMPEKVSREKESILRSFGAEVIRTPTEVPPDHPESYYKVAERITRETENAFCPNQFSNPNNPRAHYETTGPEIWRDTEGRITHLVASVGTGGTICGAARYLKRKKESVRVTGADPEGSIYHHVFDGSDVELGSYKLEGMGEDFIPDTVDFTLIDDIVVVEDKEAFLMARRLVREEGLLVGGSSGAAVHAAVQVASRLGKEDVVVVVLPDTGRNYLGTIFDEHWMREQGFLEGE